MRVFVGRTGNACASASFTTDARTGVFDNGAVDAEVVLGARSARSHTDSGAENGKMMSAISQHAAARVQSQQGDIFVVGIVEHEGCNQDRSQNGWV